MQHRLRAAVASGALIAAAAAAEAEGFDLSRGGSVTLGVWRGAEAAGSYGDALATLPAGLPALLLACASERGGATLRRVALWPDDAASSGDAARLRGMGAEAGRAAVAQGAAASYEALLIRPGQAVGWVEGETAVAAAMRRAEGGSGPALVVALRTVEGEAVAILGFSEDPAPGAFADGEGCVALAAR